MAVKHGGSGVSLPIAGGTSMSAATRPRAFSSLLSTLSLGLLLWTAPGCGGAIQYATDSSDGTSTSADSLTDLSSVESDGAQDQCTLYDESSPTRTTCIGCYDSLVSTYCPGETAIGDCADADFQEEFPDRLNQCILNSTLAGFTCSITCDDDEDLDETSCSCVSRATASTGLSAISLIDVGQYDSGPPVVTAYASVAVLSQTVAATEPCDFVGTTGSSVYLSIRNRGGTMFRDNTYSVTGDFNNDSTYVSPSFSPATKLASAYLGLNAYLNFDIGIAGANGTADSEDLITSAYSGEPGSLERLAGAPLVVTSPSPSPSPSPTSTPSADDAFPELAFRNPSAITRDSAGNVYFAETVVHTDDQRTAIYVLCLNSGFWCGSDDAGTIQPVAGNGDQSGSYRNNTGAGQGRVDARIQMITALKVDEAGNVYFSEYGRFSTDTDGDGLGNNSEIDSVVSVVCFTTSSGFCQGKGWSADNVYSILGRSNGVDPAGGTNYDDSWLEDVTATYLITGFDLEVGDTDSNDPDINIYLTTRTLSAGSTSDYGKLYAFCGFDGGDGAKGPCVEEGVGGEQELIGSTYYFSDVAATITGNLLLTSPISGRLSVYCRDTTDHDAVCGADSLTHSIATGWNVLTTPSVVDDPVASSDPASGTDIDETNLVAPAKILLSKSHANDYSTGTFDDHNIVIAEHYRKTDTDNGYAAGGNIVRIFCLDTEGWCYGRESGKSYILAGNPGKTGAGASGGTGATSVAFGDINGVTYDKYKNLVFSSGFPLKSVTTDPTDYSYHPEIYVFDNSIYRLHLKKETGSFGAKYGFTDSNAQTSYYCLSLKAQVECGLTYFDSDSDGTPEYEDACTCSLQPSDGNPQGYWRGVSSSAACD